MFKLNSKFVSVDNLGDAGLFANGYEITNLESFLVEEVETDNQVTQGTTRSTSAIPIDTTIASVTSTISDDKPDVFYPTFKEFSAALTLNHYPVPTREQYQNFKNGAQTQGGISSKIELAMFLAQVMHQSNGLTSKIEEKCGSGCLNCKMDYTYPADQPNKLYCGRGYTQLVILMIYRLYLLREL